MLAAIAWRRIRLNPLRVAATAAAIILGVAFWVGTGVLTATVDASINSSVEDAFARLDAAVRGERAQDEFRRTPIPEGMVEDIQALPQVAGAEPRLSGYAQLVASDGKTLDGLPFAYAWMDDPGLNPFKVVDGRPPAAAGEIAIDSESLKDAGYEIGDTVQVLPFSSEQRFTVVGAVATSDDSPIGEQRVVGFGDEDAALAFASSGVTAIYVRAAGDVSESELLTVLKAKVGDGFEAVSAEALADELRPIVDQLASVITSTLSAFSWIALVVGGFVIYNTFVITVTQRTREMALLRAIGAKRRQVARSVLLESAVLGVVASLIGALVGLLLGRVILAWVGANAAGLTSELVTPAGTVVAGVVVGAVLTVVAAYVPARRGARTPPIAALRDTAVESGRVPRSRTTAGTAIATGSIALLVLAIASGGLMLLALSAVAALTSVVVLGPALVRPVASIVGHGGEGAQGMVRELARENSARNPRRTSSTALALTVGVTLITTATVFAATISASIEGELKDQVLADLVVEVDRNAARVGGGLSAGATADIAQADGVAAATAPRAVAAQLGGKRAEIAGIDIAAIEGLADIGIVQGDLATLADGGIAVHTSVDNILMGDTVAVQFADGAVALEVEARYDNNQVLGDAIVDAEVLSDATATARLSQLVLVAVEPQNVVADMQMALAEVLADQPIAEVKTKSEYASDQAGRVNTLLYVLYGLLGFSVVIALLGVVNTMILSVVERTRELGLLRAVGMTARQLRRTVRRESVIIALLGTVAGIGLGVMLGFIAYRATSDVFTVFAVPFPILIVIIAVGVVAGLVAGWWPARRAGKLQVLDAITHG